MEFEKFKAECHKYALDSTVAEGGGDFDIFPQFRDLQVASPSSSPQVNVEEMSQELAEFKFKPYEIKPKQHSPLKHKGEESLLKSQVPLPKKPKTFETLATSMLMKPLTIHEWPKPTSYNGKALTYYGTIEIEDSSDEEDDDESDNEGADVDVETLSDSEEFSANSSDENEAIRDYFPQLARPVERICIGNFLPMAPIVHNPVVEDFEDDEEDDDDDDMDDEGYEDMSTEEEEEDEKEEEEKEEVVLVRSPNCLGPCAEIERIVVSDIVSLELQKGDLCLPSIHVYTRYSLGKDINI